MKLKKDEIEKFFKLHKALLYYINTKKNVVKGVSSIKEFGGIGGENAVKIREKLFEDLTIIDSFIRENSFNFTETELRIIENWKNGILEEFFIVKYDKEYTIFYQPETKKCYGVLYLNDSFEDMFGPYLPLYVKTWIIPFNGKIVYDGLIMPYSISFGAGMRKNIKLEYEEIMLKQGIITSFEKQKEKQTSDEELLKFYLKSEPNRERYWEEIEKLRKKDYKLEAIYHYEQGRSFSRRLKNELKNIQVIGYFAVIDNTIITSAQTKKELDKRIIEMIPKDKKEWVFQFKIGKLDY